MVRPARWCLVLLLCCGFGPARAESCAGWVRGTEHVIRGMFVATPDRSEDIFLFPLFAGKDTLTYVTCRSDESDRTTCRLGTVDGTRAVTSALVGCTASSAIPGRCPDFAAEGFTYGNAAAIAQMLKHNRPRLCGGLPTRARIEPLAPAKPAGDVGPEARRSDRETHFQIWPDCRIPRLPDGLGKACADLAATHATDGRTLGLSLLVAGRHSFVCAVRTDWTIPNCRRE